jgi:ligand-binding SRPBCC domain-containing protein
MPLVERTCIINASAEKVFDFHTDTHNLPLISPRWMKSKVHSVTGNGKGMRIELTITQFGIIRNRWTVVIAEFDRPTRITDIAERSPFKLFRHERIITAHGENTSELHDRFHYRLPLGVLGEVIDMLFVRRFIGRMFDFRHKRTQQLLGHGTL